VLLGNLLLFVMAVLNVLNLEDSFLFSSLQASNKLSTTCYTYYSDYHVLPCVVVVPRTTTYGIILPAISLGHVPGTLGVEVSMAS